MLDPDATLKAKITGFVDKGDFGLGAGGKPDGTYDRVWFKELLSSDEIMFDGSVFLLTKTKAKALKGGELQPRPRRPPPPKPGEDVIVEPETDKEAEAATKTIRITGNSYMFIRR